MPRFSILLVDDEKEVHKLLREFLEVVFGERFVVHSAYNGAEALEKFEQLVGMGQEPDLVLMDLRMPVMDGIEATRRIKEKHPGKEVVVLTAYSKEAELVRRAIEAGAKKIISKSIGYRKVVEEIGEILKI